MESWRDTWRRGFAPVLSTDGLRILAEALRTDDPRLIQGSTSIPAPAYASAAGVRDLLVEAADFLGFVATTQAGGFVCTAEEYRARDGAPPHTNPNAAKVGVIDEFWANTCLAADRHLGEPHGCRWLLNWFDDTPRDEMRRELLAEVERELAARAEKVSVA